MLIKLLLVLISLYQCNGAAEFSGRARNFSLELLHFSRSYNEGNLVLYPFGLWTLITGLTLGATEGSYRQLARAIILPKSKKELALAYKDLFKKVFETKSGVTLVSKNYLFVDNGFGITDEFKDKITTNLDIAVKLLDFNDTATMTKLINSYVKNTGARLSNVLTSNEVGDSKTRMILANGVYFKGSWAYQFNKSETTVEPFYDENKQIIGEVNMMYQKAPFAFSNVKEMKAFVLELPYRNRKYSMLIMMPHNKVNITEMFLNFYTVKFADIYKKLQDDIEEYNNEDIDVQVPRFKISTKTTLNKPLNAIGLYDIFNPESARFDKIADKNTYISDIVHEANIEVTETGTIACAEPQVASAFTTQKFSETVSTPRFQANRPFVYFIVEKSTTTVLFCGVYSQPSVV